MRTEIKVVLICCFVLILGAISARIWFIVAPRQSASATAPAAAESGDWVKLKFRYEPSFKTEGQTPSLDPLAIDDAKYRLKSVTSQTQVHSTGTNEIEVWLACSPQLHKAVVENAAARSYAHSGLLFEKLTPQMQAAQDAINAAKNAKDEDPADVIRLLAVSGVLEFRIPVSPLDLGGTDDAQYLKVIQDCKANGPAQAVHANDTTMRWFQIEPAHLDAFLPKPGRSPAFIIAEWTGQTYVLMYDDQSRALTHNRKPNWMITAGTPVSRDDQLLLPFSLDSVGGSYLGDLTANNLGRPLAILLDDQVIMAPTISTRISTEGEISFGNEVSTEVHLLKLILDAGALPIRFRFLSLTP